MVPIRVRFAPSPTGHMHIGNLRTALFNWLFARHNGGTFLVRIEDTDLERSLPEYTQAIIDTLGWMGIESDEPLVIQSLQIERHKEVAQKLVDNGKAYKCYCTAEELEKRLGVNAAQGEGYVQYDNMCRSLKPTIASEPYVIRFKIPDELQEITFEDAIRGAVTFKREQFDDFIIARSDGTPMYNFVVVVDDADMGITHVIRGEDHIPNTPKQLMLYRACGFQVPVFAHLSLILGPSGNRLSKRDAVTGVSEYRRLGFLADALRNYLVRLGWSHGDQEVFASDELIKLFTLDGVGKKGAIFDIQKLEWLNAFYIKQRTPRALLELIVRDVDGDFLKRVSKFGREQVLDALALYQERCKTLSELAAYVIALSSKPNVSAQLLDDISPKALEYLTMLYKKLETLDTLTIDAAQEAIKKISERYNLKIAEIAQPLRILLTGSTQSPSVYSLMALLGKDEVLKRLRIIVKEL